MFKSLPVLYEGNLAYTDAYHRSPKYLFNAVESRFAKYVTLQYLSRMLHDGMRTISEIPDCYCSMRTKQQSTRPAKTQKAVGLLAMLDLWILAETGSERIFGSFRIFAVLNACIVQ